MQDAVLSGGVQLSGWHEHAQGGRRYLLSAPLPRKRVRQLFHAGRRVELGPLTRLARESGATRRR